MKKLILFCLACLCLCLLAQPSVPQDAENDKERQEFHQRFGRDYTRKLRHGDSETKIDAADNLVLYAHNLRSLTWDLAFLLKRDQDPKVRRKAAEAITEFGPSAVRWRSSLIGELEAALNDQDEGVRIAVIGAISSTAPFSKGLIPKVIPFLMDKSPDVKRAAIGVMARYGPEAKAGVPALVELLSDPTPGVKGKTSSVRDSAVIALRQIGPDANAAAAVLLKLQDLKDDELKGLALGTLAKIIPQDKKLMPLLVDTLKNKDAPALRFSAALALGSLGSEARDAVPDLIVALKATDVKEKQVDQRIKLAIIMALGEIGPAAKDAIPAIEEVMAAGDELLVSHGRVAVKRIQGKK